MLLNGRHTADALVVGESLVIDRDQADNLGFASLSKNFDAQMTVDLPPVGSLDLM